MSKLLIGNLVKVNKGNFIVDLDFDLQFKKWYRIYTRTFAVIQMIPEIGAEDFDKNHPEGNPYLKSGIAVVPFHAADRDYSIYIKTDYFTEILDDDLRQSLITQGNMSDKLVEGNLIDPFQKINVDTNKSDFLPAELTEDQSQATVGRVVHENSNENRPFFLDKDKKEQLQNSLTELMEKTAQSHTGKNLDDKLDSPFPLPPEEMARSIMNSIPVYKPLKMIETDKEEERERFYKEYIYPHENKKSIRVGAGRPPQYQEKREFESDKFNLSQWPHKGLTSTEMQFFCKVYFQDAKMLYDEVGTYVGRGKQGKRYEQSYLYSLCLMKPELFIDVDTISYVKKINKYRFSRGVELHHGLDRRMYFFNSSNDRESYSGRINFAVGFEKASPHDLLKNTNAKYARYAKAAGKLKSSGFLWATRALSMATINFGGYDIGRYWGIDSSVGMSESSAKSESLSLIGTKHDVEINADVKNCTVVRFKLPDEILKSFSYFDRADHVSFSRMIDFQLDTISIWSGIDLGQLSTTNEFFNEVMASVPEEKQLYLKSIARRFEFCDSRLLKEQDFTESWYYLGSDLGYHSGTLDPLSLKHNPFIKLVRGTRNYDDVLDHINHAIEATFVEESKRFQHRTNVGELITSVYGTSYHGNPKDLHDELINMIGLPGVYRRHLGPETMYQDVVEDRQKTFQAILPDLDEVTEDDAVEKTTYRPLVPAKNGRGRPKTWND